MTVSFHIQEMFLVDTADGKLTEQLTGWMVNTGEWVVNTWFYSLSNSSRLFRKKNPQEGQEKSNSIINILCTVTPRKVRTPISLQDMAKTWNSIICIPIHVNLCVICFLLPSLTDFNSRSNWFIHVMAELYYCFDWLQEMSSKDLQTIENIKWDPPYDPASGWKKSSINVKNYGRMIHSSKVRFRFLHCQVSGAK